jgi:chromate reductase, NAD(P)H dehydrogenase (quinone)
MGPIIGIAGSLRERSFNRALLRAAAELAPAEHPIEIETIAGIPVYDGDLEERGGHPERVEHLRSRLAQAAGMLLVTPEYNAGIPGPIKNAIDWMSRPAKEIPEVFGDLPVALVGVGGSGGTRHAQLAWLPVLRYLGVRLYSENPLFGARAWELFERGELSDESIRERLGKVVAGFTAYCSELPRRR